MADKTTEELVHRALRELGRLETGESPSASDYEDVEELVEPLIEQLNDREITHVDDIDAISPSIFLPLARLLAIEATGAFGNAATATLLANNRAANVDSLRDREHMILRSIRARRPTRRTLKVEYF